MPIRWPWMRRAAGNQRAAEPQQERLPSIEHVIRDAMLKHPYAPETRAVILLRALQRRGLIDNFRLVNNPGGMQWIQFEVRQAEQRQQRAAGQEAQDDGTRGQGAQQQEGMRQGEQRGQDAQADEQRRRQLLRSVDEVRNVLRAARVSDNTFTLLGFHHNPESEQSHVVTLRQRLSGDVETKPLYENFVNMMRDEFGL